MNPKAKQMSVWTLSALLLILLLAAVLRSAAINGSIVDIPIRADAEDYYYYALNMKQCGAYSRQIWDESAKCPEQLRIDVQRSPGYPVFLLPWVEFPPSAAMVERIQYAQLVLGIVTVGLAYATFSPILGSALALLAGLLVALSPHLVAAGVYVLTEVLFTFLMMTWLYISSLLFRNRTMFWALMQGVLLGLVALTRPTMVYFLLFLLPLFALSLPTRGLRVMLLVAVGFFSTYGPWYWFAHTQLPPDASGSSLLKDTVHKGMYPDLKYRDQPNTYGFPNHADPTWRDRYTLELIAEEIGKRIIADPMRYAHWYLYGKPRMFLSWDIVVGQGDVWIYPLHVNPYELNDPLMDGTHALMQALHWPMVILAVVASLLIWIPGVVRNLNHEQVLLLRLMSLVLGYFVAVHIVGTPLPRYSIPLRPIIYGMALVPIVLLAQLLGFRQSVH